MSLRNRIARLEQSRRFEEASAPPRMLIAGSHEELVFILEMSNLLVDIRREPDQEKKDELQRKLDEREKEYQHRWPQQ